FLDHDDTFAPFALYEVARYLNQHADCDLLYSDHDLIDAGSGLRKQPLFKPDWSPDTMLSSNYITHLTVVRKELVQELGGFDAQKDGAQDWDLYLRAVERARHIGHIPKVLYHWRESASSTAANIYTKAYAPAAQLRSIEDHLARIGLPAPRAFHDPSGFIRVAWSPARQGKVTIIIPSRGANKMLENCIQSIFARTAYPDYEVVVVNNGPRRAEDFPYYRKLRQDSRARVLDYEGVFNYSAVNNIGARSSESEYILLLNNDTEVIHEDWLSEMVMWASRPEIGAVGAKLLLPDGRIQHAGVILGLTGFAGHVFGGRPEGEWGCFGLAEWYRDYMAVTAACVLFRREVYEKMGGLDESFLLCGNDVELGLRLNQSGYRVLYHPFVRLYHLESATHKGSIPNEDFDLSFKCYSHVLKSGDPFFNPNLSYWDLAPRLSHPGERLPYEFARSHIASFGKGV
ncbi:MAG: glycosyltransferase, partial [Chloroflexi bacterium]